MLPYVQEKYFSNLAQCDTNAVKSWLSLLLFAQVWSSNLLLDKSAPFSFALIRFFAPIFCALLFSPALELWNSFPLLQIFKIQLNLLSTTYEASLSTFCFAQLLFPLNPDLSCNSTLLFVFLYSLNSFISLFLYFQYLFLILPFLPIKWFADLLRSNSCLEIEKLAEEGSCRLHVRISSSLHAYRKATQGGKAMQFRNAAMCTVTCNFAHVQPGPRPRKRVSIHCSPHRPYDGRVEIYCVIVQLSYRWGPASTLKDVHAAGRYLWETQAIHRKGPKRSTQCIYYL